MKNKVLILIMMVTLLSGCSAEEFDTSVNILNTGKDVLTELFNDDESSSSDIKTDVFSDSGLQTKDVAVCNLSGEREANIVVNIGAGDREYYAATNKYGQLVEVYAPELIIQNDKKEDVKSSGRYCNDEANVKGTEKSNLDQGHIIADSLGGVSNAYNITPQNSNLNRHGMQAKMEEQIREALKSGKKVTEFTAIITYPNDKTQTPSHYEYSYQINGKNYTKSFDNKD